MCKKESRSSIDLSTLLQLDSKEDSSRIFEITIKWLGKFYFHSHSDLHFYYAVSRIRYGSIPRNSCFVDSAQNDN